MEEINIDELEFSEDDLNSSALAHLSINARIEELTKRHNLVTSTLHQQVRDKHGALLQQATHAGRFDAALNLLAEDVQRLRGSGQMLKTQVGTQYQLIENQTKVLGHLHELSHLLRSAGTLLTLTAKLKNTKDVLKQAELHYELGQLIEDKDLKDIDFIQNARTYVISSRQRLRNLTQMQLVTGLQERNETQVLNALKIFNNFNTLDKSLDNLITTYISELEQSLKECFAGTDISVLNKSSESSKASSLNLKANGSNTSLRGPGKTPQLTTTQNFRAKFWKSLHWLLYDELYESCEQIRLLKHALEQINQFGHALEREQTIQNRFWQAVQKLLMKSFAECPAHVSQTLQEGLSKLLTSARGLEERLATADVANRNVFQFDNEIFVPLEVGYVSKCAANLKACLAGIDLPSNETVDNFIQVASTELSSALIDVGLTNSIAAAFMACGKELCTKLEAQIKLGADTKQVVDIPNVQQMQNTLLANILYYYKDSVRRMLADLKGQFDRSTHLKAQEDIAKSLDHANLLINTILQQIMDSILSTSNIIILSMHREPGLNVEKIAINGPSMYMKELQEFIARSWTNHIIPFDDKELITKCGLELAKRCIELFIHNLSILRPLSNAGRQRLKTDCVFMEQALRPVCSNLADLGKLARLLRAMSILIVQQPSELVEQQTSIDAAESLVPSYIVLFLLFGHAGPELQSPHTTANWSNERLIEWLEGHTSEREKLELISGALQRYRDSVRRKNSDQYDEVYPLILEFFENAVKANEVHK